MTLDFSLLRPDFSLLAKELIAAMTDEGYEVSPYYGIRTLRQQAQLYRRSRMTAEIQAKIDELRSDGCEFLADILESVGPQRTGAWATNALPGESFHNFGLAIDCLLKKGCTLGNDADYKVFADIAKKLGLTSGYYFKRPDMGHIQLGKQNRPFGYTLKQINDYFKNFKGSI